MAAVLEQPKKEAFRVNIPNVGVVSFPSDMGANEIAAASERLYLEAIANAQTRTNVADADLGEAELLGNAVVKPPAEKSIGGTAAALWYGVGGGATQGFGEVLHEMKTGDPIAPDADMPAKFERLARGDVEKNDPFVWDKLGRRIAPYDRRLEAMERKGFGPVHHSETEWIEGNTDKGLTLFNVPSRVTDAFGEKHFGKNGWRRVANEDAQESLKAPLEAHPLLRAWNGGGRLYESGYEAQAAWERRGRDGKDKPLPKPVRYGVVDQLGNNAYTTNQESGSDTLALIMARRERGTEGYANLFNERSQFARKNNPVNQRWEEGKAWYNEFASSIGTPQGVAAGLIKASEKYSAAAQRQNAYDINPWGGDTAELGQAVGSIVPPVVIGLVTRNPTLAVMGGAAVGSAQKWGTTRSEAFKAYKRMGLSDVDADKAAAEIANINASITFGVTVASGGVLSKLPVVGKYMGHGVEGASLIVPAVARAIGSIAVEGGKKTLREIAVNAAKHILGQATSEGIEEATDEILSAAANMRHHEPDLTWGEAMSRAAHAFKLGFILGGGVQTPARALRAYSENLANNNAPATAEAMERLADESSSEALPPRSSDPQKVGDAVVFINEAHQPVIGTVAQINEDGTMVVVDKSGNAETITNGQVVTHSPIDAKGAFPQATEAQEEDVTVDDLEQLKSELETEPTVETELSEQEQAEVTAELAEEQEATAEEDAGPVGLTRVDPETGETQVVTSVTQRSATAKPTTIDATSGAVSEAKVRGIELSEVTGTGKDGRILKRDVQKVVNEEAVAKEIEQGGILTPEQELQIAAEADAAVAPVTPTDPVDTELAALADAGDAMLEGQATPAEVKAFEGSEIGVETIGGKEVKTHKTEDGYKFVQNEDGSWSDGDLSYGSTSELVGSLHPEGFTPAPRNLKRGKGSAKDFMESGPTIDSTVNDVTQDTSGRKEEGGEVLSGQTVEVDGTTFVLGEGVDQVQADTVVAKIAGAMETAMKRLGLKVGTFKVELRRSTTDEQRASSGIAALADEGGNLDTIVVYVDVFAGHLSDIPNLNVPVILNEEANHQIYNRALHGQWQAEGSQGDFLSWRSQYLANVASEITAKERAAVAKAYKGMTGVEMSDDSLVMEYVRMVMQAKQLGVITESTAGMRTRISDFIKVLVDYMKALVKDGAKGQIAKEAKIGEVQLKKMQGAHRMAQQRVAKKAKLKTATQAVADIDPDATVQRSTEAIRKRAAASSTASGEATEAAKAASQEGMAQEADAEWTPERTAMAQQLDKPLNTATKKYSGSLKVDAVSFIRERLLSKIAAGKFDGKEGSKLEAALVQAAKSFDVERVRFETRQKRGSGKVGSLDAPLSEEGGATVGDMTEAPADETASTTERMARKNKLLREAMAKVLSAEESRAMELVKFDGLTVKAAAKEMGISTGKVSGLITGAMKKLQESPEVRPLLREAMDAAPAPEIDEDYLAAVESGDTKAADKMVAKAAKDAGYTIGPVYHGTDFEGEILAFEHGEAKYSDSKKKGDRVRRSKNAFFFAEREKTARAHGDTVYKVFLKIDNPFTTKVKTDQYGFIEGYDAPDWSKSMTKAEQDEFTDMFEMERNDGFIIEGNKDLLDSTFGEEDAYDQYGVYDPSQIKSAETVTRDKQGNVIPLSERFDPDSDLLDMAPAPDAATPAPTDGDPALPAANELLAALQAEKEGGRDVDFHNLFLRMRDRDATPPQAQELVHATDGMHEVRHDSEVLATMRGKIAGLSLEELWAVTHGGKASELTADERLLAGRELILRIEADIAKAKAAGDESAVALLAEKEQEAWMEQQDSELLAGRAISFLRLLITEGRRIKQIWERAVHRTRRKKEADARVHTDKIADDATKINTGAVDAVVDSAKVTEAVSTGRKKAKRKREADEDKGAVATDPALEGGAEAKPKKPKKEKKEKSFEVRALEMLVRRMKAKAKAKGAEKSATEKFIQRLISSWRKHLKQMAVLKGEEALAKVDKMTSREVLLSALSDRDAARAAFGSAFSYVLKNYKGEQLAAIEAELTELAQLPYSGALEAQVADFVKDEADIKALIKKHYTEQGKASKSLAETLIAEGGLTPVEAAEIEAAVQREVERQTKVAKKKAVDELVKRAKRLGIRNTNQIRGEAEKLVALSNMGALSREDAWAAIRDKHNLPEYSPEIARKLQELADAVDAAPAGNLKNQKANEMLSFISKQQELSKEDLALAFYYSSILSGLGTQMVNAGGSAFNLAMRLGHAVSQHPKQAGQILMAAYRGLTQQGFLEFQAAWKDGDFSGRRSFDPYANVGGRVETGAVQSSAPNALELAAESDQKWLQRIGWIKWVQRFMTGVDLMFYKSGKEMKASVLALKIAKENPSLSRAEILEVVERELFITDEAVAEADTQARSELGLAAVSEGALTPKNKRDINRRKWEIVEQSREDDIEAQSKQAGLETTYTQTPQGIIGWLADSIDNAVQKGTAEGKSYPRWLKAAFIPFTRTIANVLNEKLMYVPAIGLLRTREGAKTWNLTEEQRSLVYFQQFTGALGLMALYLLAMPDDDDEDEGWFEVTALGTRNRERRKQLEASGWKPYTVRIGNLRFNYAEWPIGNVLGMIGAAADKKKYGNKELGGTDLIGIAVMEQVQVPMRQGFLSSLKGLSDAVGSGSPNAVIRHMGKMPTGFIPRFAKDAERVFNPTLVDSDTFDGAILEQMPVARAAGRPKLNVLGEPMVLANMDRIALGRVVRLDQEDKFFDLIRKKGVFVPTVARVVPLGKTVMTDEQRYRYVKRRGQEMAKKLRSPATLRRMEKMDREDLQDYLSKISTAASKRIKRQMRRE